VQTLGFRRPPAPGAAGTTEDEHHRWNTLESCCHVSVHACFEPARDAWPVATPCGRCHGRTEDRSGAYIVRAHRTGGTTRDQGRLGGRCSHCARRETLRVMVTRRVAVGSVLSRQHPSCFRCC
jgi:hypothetical protein